MDNRQFDAKLEEIGARIKAAQAMLLGYEAENRTREIGGMSPAFGIEHYEKQAAVLEQCAFELRRLLEE